MVRPPFLFALSSMPLCAVYIWIDGAECPLAFLRRSFLFSAARPTAFSSSTTTSGTKASAVTISHCCGTRATVLKICANGGMTMTLSCKTTHTTAAKTNFLLRKIPARKTDCDDRILNVCTTWEKLSTANAIVRPMTGDAGSISKKIRPML